MHCRCYKKKLKTKRNIHKISKTWWKLRKIQEVKPIRRRINHRKCIIFKFRFFKYAERWFHWICYTRDIGIILNMLVVKKLLWWCIVFICISKIWKRAAAVLLFRNDDDSTTMHFEFHSPLAMFMFLGWIRNQLRKKSTLQA